MPGQERLFRDPDRHRKALLLGRNDGASLDYCCRYDPSGGDPDHLAQCDVRRMRDALLARGCEVLVVGEQRRTFGEIVDDFRAAARSCRDGDEFLFYFSGHAQLRGDRFSLVLAHGDFPELLHASAIIEALQEGCPARSKLVILDCCYAADVGDGWQPRRHDNLRFLVSTRRFVRGKEVRALEGGIFTYCLHEALTDEAHWSPHGDNALIDDAGHIWSDRLLNWLKRRIPEVGQQHHPGETFPEPTGDGGQDEPFLVASVPVQTITGPATGFQQSARDALVDLIEPIAKQIDVGGIYESVCSQAGLTALDRYRGPIGGYATLGLRGAVEVLASAWYREVFRVRLPLA